MNPNVVAGDGATPKQAAARWYVNKSDFPDLVINDSLTASCFIDTAQLALNGRVLTDTIDLSHLSFLYKSFNRKLTTFPVRLRDKSVNQQLTPDDREKNSVIIPAYAANAEATPGLASFSALYDNKESPAFREARSNVCHSAWDDANPIIKAVSLDGYPLLSRPRCNAMAALHKTSDNNSQFFLCPNTKLTYHIHFRADPMVMMDHVGVEDAVYFNKATPAAVDPMAALDLKISIKNILLSYESFVPHSNSMLYKSIAPKKMTLHMDRPRISTYLLQQGANMTKTNIVLKGGEKALALAWSFGHSLW